LIATAVLIALSGALAGCGSTGNFDPSDLLAFLDTKKKLPGDRKPVFPEGVPGLEQGVPKDLYKGARQQVDDPNAQAAAAGSSAGGRTESKRGANPRANRPPPPPLRQRPRRRPRGEGGTAAAPPAPKPAKIVRKRTTAPPPRTNRPRLLNPATVRFPGADAERYVHALISSFRSIDTPFEKGRLDHLCPLRSPSSAAPMSASRRCSTGWLGRSWRWSMTSPASPATAARAMRVSAISNSP
jgi:hypothetical protein